MTAKEYLDRIWRIDQRIERRCEELDRLRARLEKATAQITGMPHGGSGGDWTDASVKAIELEQRIRGEIAEMVKVKNEVIDVINAVEDKRYRDLLEMRYRNGWRFEKIAVEMNYDWRHVMRLYHEALDAVKVPEGSE